MGVKLTIIIPSKTELFLEQTIRDILKNSTSEIEVLPFLDGYNIPLNEFVADDRVRYVRFPQSESSQKRHMINQGVSEARGEYVMWVDAHCMFAPGFDTQLIKDHQPDWVQIPRRNRLDAENWSLQPQVDKRPPIDYEYLMWRPIATEGHLHGFKWDERTLERWNIPIDDTIQVQGSCIFMTKKWFEKCGFMDIRYQGWGQEAEEICFTTRLNGGKVKTNKNTWYAHLHKGDKYGRMYHLPQGDVKKSYEYASKIWLHERLDFFIQVVEQFPLMPEWPKNWKEELWKRR